MTEDNRKTANEGNEEESSRDLDEVCGLLEVRRGHESNVDERTPTTIDKLTTPHHTQPGRHDKQKRHTWAGPSR